MSDEVQEAVKNIKGKEYQGSSIRDGVLYHDIPFDEFKNIESHRKNNLQRWNLIKSYVSFTGKTVIDLGSSVGAMSLLAANDYAKSVVGYDQDNHSLDVARLIAAKLKLTNVKFIQQKIDLDFIKGIEKVDIIVCMSIFMWLRKMYGPDMANEILKEISRKASVMIFETACERDGQAPIAGLKQNQVKDFLLKPNTLYKHISDLGTVPGWHERHVFLCRN